MKKNTTTKKQHILRAAALVTLMLTVLTLLPCAASVDAASDVFAHRYDTPTVLPYKSEHTFTHKKDSSLSTLAEPLSLTFHAPTMSIVSICFTKGKSADGAYSDITVSVYSDTGELIIKKSAEDSMTLLQFIPVYTGKYHITVESRSASEGEFLCPIEISASTGYSENEISEYPHTKSYTNKNHKTNEVRELYSKTMYPTTEYKLSVFELSHSAACIVSYKINTQDKSAVRAVLYTNEGERYMPHQSHATSSYMAGDAQQLSYRENAYLLVYSLGEFSLEIDLIEHNEYKIDALSSDYKGEIKLSDSTPMYDQDKIDALIAEFPFCSIKNKNVKFFKIISSKSSIVSYLCERKEHSCFSLVSDAAGLSPDSVYPLRSFNEYCSEVDPTELCYNSVICDTDTVYLAYTGTDTSAYVELYSSPTHKSSTELEEKYSQDKPLPQIVIDDIYSDRHIYERLGIEQQNTNLTRINGYMLVSEANSRHYYSSSDTVTPPAQKGEYKLYVIINSSYKDANGNTEEKYYTYLVDTIRVDARFSLPTIDEIISAVESNDPIALILVLVFFLLIAGGITISVKVLVSKYSLSKDALERPMRVSDFVKKKEENNENKQKEESANKR
ncbi:MAG: hypothetical protein IJE84_04425 [Clostridia bacterium]|nr:hypothetical protein [Clostridia bacterium]